MADTFEADISRWVEKARRRTDAAPLAIANAAAERVKELTPVVTGRLRAGWQVEVDGKNVLITNNVEYARRINDGFVGTDSLGRKYDQVGQHMVEQVIAELPDIAAKAVDGL